MATDREELPFAADPFERVAAAVIERDVGAGDEVADGPGDQHLAVARRSHDPGGDVDGDPTDVGPSRLHLAGVQARPDLDAKLPEPVAQRGGAADRGAGAVEGGQDAVTGGLHQPAT